ncbi:MAG: EamA family transporter [Lachnospiraceae bacterium]|jgi:drug/metabolite transporter (DMT)-like permease|nr:EamA family transporter [Lachnospiraceae bacterium]
MLLIGSTDSVRGFDIRGLLFLSATFLMEALNGVIIRYLKEEYSAAEISFASCAISFGITMIVLAFQFGFHVIELPVVLAAFQEGKFVAAVLFFGFFGTFVVGILKGYMLQHMTALKATAWFNAGTPAAVIAGVLFLKEPLYFYQVACTILILTGVIGTQVCRSGGTDPRPGLKTKQKTT